MTDNKSGRIKQIEGLRGISMLFVMSSHFFHRFLALYTEYNPTTGIFKYADGIIKELGALGVAVFLFISGFFVIPRDRKIKPGQYLLKRVLRLWPSYFIAITVCYILTHLIYLPDRTVTIRDYILNVFWINGYIGTPYVDHAHWYITTIISCSILFSFIYRFPPEKRHLIYWIWLIVDLAVSLFDTEIKVLHLIRAGLAVLLGSQYAPIVIIGATIADIKNQRIGKMFLVTIILSLIVKYLTGGWIKFVLMCIAACLFIPTLCNKIKFFERKPFVFLGGISYTTYVIHQNIGYVLMYVLLTALGSYHIWTSFAALLLSLFLGYGLYRINKKIMIAEKKLFGSVS